MFRSKKEFAITHLSSGGIIANYYCTSACAHCLYGCSPRWPKDYIDEGTARSVFRRVRSLGCHSVHLGGGEPFLNLGGLESLLEAAQRSGIHVEYVETNSSWYRGWDDACESLRRLQQIGLQTLLISISPFHNGHIPFIKVKKVMAACREVGIRIFPWISDFFHEVDAFDDKVSHSLSEYEEKYGGDYLRQIPTRYWVHFGGRALKTFFPKMPVQTLSAVLSKNPEGCTELSNVNHFHFDLYGCYVPGLCSGLAIRLEDVGEPLIRANYPILAGLYRDGINGLFQMAVSDYDFQPETHYLTKCHLCYDIRKYLVCQCEVESLELHPRDFYELV